MATCKVEDGASVVKQTECPNQAYCDFTAARFGLPTATKSKPKAKPLHADKIPKKEDSVMKRPAAADFKVEYKRVYARAYHKALTAGLDKDAARKAGQEAVGQMA